VGSCRAWDGRMDGWMDVQGVVMMITHHLVLRVSQEGDAFQRRYGLKVWLLGVDGGWVGGLVVLLDKKERRGEVGSRDRAANE